jgi:FdhD protein
MSPPILTSAQTALTTSTTVLDEKGRTQVLSVPTERPLTIYLDKRELVTLMTLGAAPEALTLGYLRNQRLVDNLTQIASVQVDWEVESVAVTTHHGIHNLDALTAKKIITSGCGQGTMFGGLMDDVAQRTLNPHARMHQATLYKIVDFIRTHPSVYRQAGSVHGCALFNAQGELIYFVEDVGRHNAVDAISGRMWLDGLVGDETIFYTTGRLTSEMVIKGAQMGIPFLLSRSGTTQMGLEVSQNLNVSLFGRCTGKHFFLFNGAERFVAQPELAA